MSRKSRENKLNENMDKMNQTFKDLNNEMGKMTDKMSKMSDIAKDIASINNQITTQMQNQTKQLDKQENQRKKDKAKQRETERDLARSNYNKYIADTREQYDGSNRKIPTSITQWLSRDYQQSVGKDKRMTEALNQAISNAEKTVRGIKGEGYTTKGGNFTKKGYEKLQEEVAKSMRKSTKKFEKSVNGFQSASESFISGLGSQLWSLIKNVFGVVYNTAKEGMNRQVSAYEDTFEGISVRNGTTRSQYYDTQTTISDTLKSLDLNENIGASEVQRMLSTLATNGMAIDLSDEESRAKTVANAIDTVLTNKIVPYLDVSSESIQQFAVDQPNLMKQLRGIGATTMEISGSAVFATKHLQEMIDELSPIARQSEQELGLQYAKATQQYESLRAQGKSDYEIGELYKTAESVYSDPYAALTSKDIVKSMAVARTISSGGDLRSFGDVNTNFLSAAQTIGSMVPSGRLSILYAGAMPTSLSPTTLAGYANNKIDLVKVIEDGTKATNEVLENAQEKTDDYVNNINQTMSQLGKNTLENLTTELAKVTEKLGILGDTIEKAIEKAIVSLGSFVTSWLLSNIVGGVIGKGIGALAGAQVGGTGAGILAGAGGIALGVIGGIAANQAIEQAIINADIAKREQRNQASIDKGEKNKGNSFDNASTQAILEQVNSMANTGSYKGLSGHIETATNAYERFGMFGIGKLGLGNNYSAKEKEAWKMQDWKSYNIYKPLSVGINDYANVSAEDRMAFIIAYALALREVGYLGDNIMSEIFGNSVKVSTDEDLYMLIASAYKNMGLGASAVKNAANYIKSDVGGPYSSDGKEWDGTIMDTLSNLIESQSDKYEDKSIVENAINFYGHRHGLAEVPYDEYPSLLHEGEAVLTASTANELRNLLDEYRSNNQSIITIDATLQNQTVQLVNKLDEIISTINNLNSGNSITSTSSLDQQHARNRLLSSMTHMTNTKDALR